MRPRTTGRRLLMVSVLGAVLIGSLSILPGHAQTSDRHNPVRAAYMRAHFHQALLVHDAVARGDLARARAEATTLADISPTVPMPPGAEAFQGALTQAARDAAAATTLYDAAHATATLLGTCGQCHKANHVRATVPAAKDVQVGGLVGHMLLHQKGVDDLLEGLVAPSDTQWVEGVRIFASPEARPARPAAKGAPRDGSRRDCAGRTGGPCRARAADARPRGGLRQGDCDLRHVPSHARQVRRARPALNRLGRPPQYSRRALMVPSSDASSRRRASESVSGSASMSMTT